MEKQEQFTKYEKARILGARALQLSMDAPVLLNIDKEKLEELNYDVLKIAELEFKKISCLSLSRGHFLRKQKKSLKK